MRAFAAVGLLIGVGFILFAYRTLLFLTTFWATLRQKKKSRDWRQSRLSLGPTPDVRPLRLRSIVPCACPNYAIGLSPYACVVTTLPSRR